MFNGTTFKKIFDAGYKFIVGSSMDESTKAVNDRIDSLIESVKKLKKKIESSKLFIHVLIHKIREQGRLRIVKKSKHNPKYSEYESSSPDLNVETQKERNFKTWDPDDLEENFNVTIRERKPKLDQLFKYKMNRNIEKSHHNYFVNNKNTWRVFNDHSSYKKTNTPIVTIKDMYEKLEVPEHLNKYFMIDYNSAVFFVDGHLISSSTKEEMMKNFKRLIPNDIEQKFISQYANPSLLREPYLKLTAEYPVLNNSRILRAKNFYEITHLEDGSIRIIDSNLSDFYTINPNDVTEHHTFGVKATVIFSYTKAPIIKYSYFVH